MLDEDTGLCMCEDGYHMHPTFGCLTCQYMIPGCASCSEVYWDTGIPLDNVRMHGPDSTSCDKSLTCNACQLSERYLKLSWDHVFSAKDFSYKSMNYFDLPDGIAVSSPVSCDNCQTLIPGCARCGTFG